MKTLFYLLAATALLCGCNQKPAPVKWEYKEVVVENRLDTEHLDLNSTNFLDAYRYEKSDPGDFDFDSPEPRKYHQALDDYGADGWELVSAVPMTETIPKAEYSTGFDYSRTPPIEDFKPFINIRTGKIILIFKRPGKK